MADGRGGRLLTEIDHQRPRSFTSSEWLVDALPRFRANRTAGPGYRVTAILLKKLELGMDTHQDDEIRTMGKGTPGSLVKGSTGNAVVALIISEPCDGLLLPCGRSSVPLQSPSVESAVRRTRGRASPDRLVA